jgi:hypothetical protein
MMTLEDKSNKPRFVNAAQLAYMKNLRLPALIVPFCCGVGTEGPRVFHTTEGTIPCLMTVEEGREMAELPRATWRIVPGGVAICVESPTDKQDEYNSFEKWLQEHDYPYDRIE